MEHIDEIMGLADDVEYVSFDVFDTLIIRPYVRPTDLFRHMELLIGVPGFADLRVRSERMARNKHSREITLDDIYAEMGPKYERFSQMETDMEIRLSVPNGPVVDILNRLIADEKKVILISDMYLPTVTIESILHSCGIEGHSGLYVSSKYGVTKCDGDLYGLVLKDLGARPDELLHVGDSRHSDYDVPKRLGIGAYRLRRPMDAYKKKHRDEYRFYRRNRTIQRSIMISVDMINGLSDRVWFDMGRRFGGPLATSYSLIINSDLHDIASVLYASRDGYNLKRISDMLFPEVRTHYIHAQRLLLDVLTDFNLPYGPIDLPGKISDRYRFEKTSTAVRRVLDFFSDELGLEVPSDSEDAFRAYISRIDEIDALRKGALEDYTEFVRSVCRTEEIHLVDCTTMKFSSQKLLEKVIGRKVKGHYLVTLRPNEYYDHDSMCEWHSPVIGWMNVDIPEFFLCSPEYPLSGWRNGPEFDESNEFERHRVSVYQDVSDGELDYALRYKGILGRFMIPFDYWSLVKWSKLSTVRGTVYFDNLKKIKWASDPDHSEYGSLITGVGSVVQVVRKILLGLISKINKE